VAIKTTLTTSDMKLDKDPVQKSQIFRFNELFGINY